jgi:hypothetical protein
MMFRRLQKQLHDTELGTGSGTTGTRTCTYVQVQWGYNINTIRCNNLGKVDTMATRTFDVYETGDLFKVRLSVTGSKKARIVRHHLQGYASIKAARADGALAIAHLIRGKQMPTFEKQLGINVPSRDNTNRDKAIRKKRNGCIKKAYEKQV